LHGKLKEYWLNKTTPEEGEDNPGKRGTTPVTGGPVYYFMKQPPPADSRMTRRLRILFIVAVNLLAIGTFVYFGGRTLIRKKVRLPCKTGRDLPLSIRRLSGLVYGFAGHP